jgi:hypothetical protein
MAAHPLKCASDSAPRKSMSCGAASTSACMAGFLLSRMRSGLLCRRRWASSHPVARHAAPGIGNQRIAVRTALSGLAQAVDFQAHMLAFDQAQLAPQRTGHAGSSRHPRRGRQGPVPQRQAGGTGGSGPFAGARGGTSDPRSRRACGPSYSSVVLDHRAHHAGGGLGAQREPVAVHRIGEGVHLLFDDVGHLAQAAHKQCCGLDDGGVSRYW